MFKRIATLVLFAALILAAFLQYFYIRDASKEYVKLTKEAAVYAKKGDMENAYLTVLHLSKKWNEKKDHFEALMEHNELDKISMSVEKSMSFAEQKESVQFVAEISVLSFLFDHIHEIDVISLENIL